MVREDPSSGGPRITESEHIIFLYPGYPMEKSDSQLSISIEVSLDICLNLRSQAITHFVLFLLSSLIF
jgi:hypothetical protein